MVAGCGRRSWVRWRPRRKGGRRPAAAPLGGGELASGWSRRRPRVEPPLAGPRPAQPGRAAPLAGEGGRGVEPQAARRGGGPRRWPEDGRPCRQRAGRPGREEGGRGRETTGNSLWVEEIRFDLFLFCPFLFLIIIEHMNIRIYNAF